MARQAVLDDDTVGAPAARPAAVVRRPGLAGRLGTLLRLRAPSPRLGRRDRHVLAGVVVLAIAATGVAWVLATVATTSFFGTGPSPREEAVAAHDVRAAVWAAATPVCTWVVLRRDRWAGVAVGTWLALLAVAAPWWWPGEAQHAVDVERPVWQHPSGWALWGLGLAFVAVTVWTAWTTWTTGTVWPRGGRVLRHVVVLVAVALLVGGVATRRHLADRAGDDVPADAGLVTVG